MHYDTLLGLLDGFHKARVLVLGDVMLDRYVYGSVERISPEAPIPVMSVERSIDMPGGAANVVRNVAAMGARAILVGVVGNDISAQDLRALLALTPSIEAYLISDAARSTTVKTRYVAGRQQVLRVDKESCAPLALGVAKTLLNAYRQALLGADVVVLSDYAKGVLSDEVTREAISAAQAAGKAVVVDPKSQYFTKYSGASLLTPNRYELERASGHECATDEQVVTGARRILEDGVSDAIVVTRGKDGMSLVKRDGSAVHLHTTAREVFDVSGAGDTALAALSLGLAGGGDLVDVSNLANLAAGIVVGKLGTAVVTTGEIIASLDAYATPSTNSKIFSLARVVEQVERWRERGLKIAFTNGCFDLLHPGHISLLDQARRTADKLVVALNADLSVRRLKGSGRPVQSEVARATVLSSLKSVDAVVIFSEDTPLELIRTIQPDVLVKGSDYTVETVVGADLVVAQGGRVVLADIVQGHSTTNTLLRVVSLDK
jgi:D-beta-D-heptose 7-phosphate kinase / D-beta-D-heptose 1-phosphate adenosyltransferase